MWSSALTLRLTRSSAFLFGLCCTESLFAQSSAEPLAFAQRLVFPSTVAVGGPADTQYAVDVIRFRIRFPVFVNGKKTILLPGLSYEHLDVGTRGPLAARLVPVNPGSNELSLHAPLVEIGLVHRFNERWLTVSTISTGLSSDFAGSHSHDDWAIIGRLVALYRAGSKLTLGIGTTYDRSTGNLSFVPIGIVKWAPSSRWLLTTLLPKVVLVSYRTSSWLSSGLRAELDFNRYHLDEGRYGRDHLYLRYLGVLFGPSLTYSPDRLVHVDCFTGAALRWVGTFVHEGSLGADLYFNADAPTRQVLLEPAAFFSLRLWIGEEGWSAT